MLNIISGWILEAGKQEDRKMNADDLLRRALEELERSDADLCQEFYTGGEWESPPIIEEIRAYLDDKNPSTSISSEEVDKSTQKRLAIQRGKPMTGEKRTEGYIELEGTLGPDAHLWSFLSGICWAEKHHGISGEDK